jgi:pyruvate dehydrogenase E2 component (dihydrolipoamide acetyltransferase)
VDLAGLTGTGPGGAIVGADVPEGASTPAPKKAKTGTDADAMRMAVARAMERSKREIPHYYLGTEVDMGPALAWLERTNASLPPPERLLSAVLLLKATALAVAKVPEMNGFWRNGRMEVAEEVHLGVAISLRGGGLVAPALHRADQLDLGGLMRGLNDLVRRARRGRLRGSEMMDATLTMTSMGDRGVSDIYGVIYPPQVAIVGFGRAVERPWVVDGSVVPRPVMRVTLAGDHRAHDGHRGGLYLAEIQRLLEDPESLT